LNKIVRVKNNLIKTVNNHRGNFLTILWGWCWQVRWLAGWDFIWQLMQLNFSKSKGWELTRAKTRFFV